MNCKPPAFRHRFHAAELFSAAIKLYPALFRLMQDGKARSLSGSFRERIMLAVTEVNGCALCSYAHARMALEEGIPEEEINALLSASSEHVPLEERKAVFYAQHYADTLGKPDSAAYQTILDEYGPQKTRVIIASIRTIMYGNVCGLPASAFLSRLRGKPYSNSSLFYELGMILAILPATLLAFFPAAINLFLGRTILKMGGK